MAQRQRATYEITERKQIEAMNSPVRLEILDAVRVSGRCSIAEIATVLGRAPDSLYYHVRKLEGVGLLEIVGERPVGRRVETLYRTPGRRLRTPFPDDQAGRGRVLKIYTALLRLTERDFRATIAGGLAILTGRRRNIRHGRIKGWLSDTDVQQVQSLIDQIFEIFESEGEPDDATKRRLYALTTFLLPLEPTKRRR